MNKHKLGKEIAKVEKARKALSIAEKTLGKKVQPIVREYVKAKDLQSLVELTHELPDSIERFYVFQAIQGLKAELAVKSKS